jgi:uncharacterized membrane protein
MSSYRSAHFSDPTEPHKHIRLKDVSIKNLLAAVLSLQIALWAVMLLNALGISIPIVQPLIGFIYLTFVPGILVLTALRMRDLEVAEIAVYAVGLSIAIVQSIGFVANLFFSSSSVIKPFSPLTVTGSVSFVVLLLCAIAYYRNRVDQRPLFATKMSAPLAPTLLLCTLPFLAVFSTLFVNNYNASGGQLFVWVILGLLVVLIAFDKAVPSKLYPLAVFVIALTLIFQQTLISAWLTGADIQGEWRLAQLVLNSGVWNLTLLSKYNAMLSVVSLAPIYSIILNLGVVWIFKIVYSFILALVPVALYQAFRRQLNPKVAFLSCFYFVSFATYYAGLPGLARQEIAELFFVLMILLIVSEEINHKIRSAMFLTFGLSLVVSHYGLSYIAILFLFLMWLMLTAARARGSRLTLRQSRAETGTREDRQIMAPSPRSPPSLVTIVSLSILFIASTAWYFYMASGSITVQFITLLQHVASSIGDLFSPTYSEAIYTVQQGPLPGILHRVNAGLNYLNLLFTLLGVCSIVFVTKQRFKLQMSYVALSVIAFGFLAASVALPYLGSGLDWQRIYQITLIILAPSFAIGFITVGEAGGAAIRKVAKRFRLSNSAPINRAHLTRLLAVYLVFFMLFSTGFVFAVTEGYRNIAMSNQIDGLYSPQTIAGATWQAANIGAYPLSGKYVTIFHYFNNVRYNDTTTVTSSDGQITFTRTFGIAGPYVYYATFDGDVFNPSTSDAVNVNVGGSQGSSQATGQATTNVSGVAPTSTALSVSDITPAVGQTVTFTATLAAGQIVYSDWTNAFFFTGVLGLGEQQETPFYLNKEIAGGSNIFLGTWNIEHNKASLLHEEGVNMLVTYANYTPLINNRSLVYSNGGASVYSYDWDYMPRITPAAVFNASGNNAP